jgi:hypothetical protein
MRAMSFVSDHGNAQSTLKSSGKLKTKLVKLDCRKLLKCRDNDATLWSCLCREERLNDVVMKNVTKFCTATRAMKQKSSLLTTIMIVILVQETLHNSAELIVQHGPIVEDED